MREQYKTNAKKKATMKSRFSSDAIKQLCILTILTRQLDNLEYRTTMFI